MYTKGGQTDVSYSLQNRTGAQSYSGNRQTDRPVEGQTDRLTNVHYRWTDISLYRIEQGHSQKIKVIDRQTDQ